MAHDQLDTLSRVRDLGVGLGLSPARFTEKRIVSTLDELIGNPDYKSRAREISRTFEPDLWIRRTCELVEELPHRFSC
jgi:UDP:flavonoid glycosyltransferase YjiC (YdhE family)